MRQEDLSAFDPKASFSIRERSLPHWSQAGALCFVTWRLADSLPVVVLEKLDQEILSLVTSAGMSSENWTSQLKELNDRKRAALQWKLFSVRDRFLGAGYGDCLLNDHACAQQVVDSLLHFNEQRYLMTDIVVMPNHVHFICAFAEEDSLLNQCRDWKRFTARRINEIMGRKGPLWQVDQFDHLIRSDEQFLYLRRYIADNPAKSRLKEGEYILYSRMFEK